MCLVPRASHRLDLLLVPDEPERVPDAAAFAEICERWREEGVLGEGGRGGPRAAALVEGGFSRLSLDLPGRVGFYANQLGGFRVRCPETGEPIVPAFNLAMADLRRGGPRSLHCPSCGQRHALEGLAFLPEAAFARGALILADAGGAVVQPLLAEGAGQVMGAWKLLLRRPG